MNRRPRILFVCSRHPFPPWRGDQLRSFHLIRCLAEHASLRLLCFGDEAATLPLDNVGVLTIRATIAGRVRANLGSPSPALPAQVRLFLDHGMRRAVAEELERWRPDVLHCTLSRMAPYLRAPRGVHRHLDLVDSMALNMRARAQASGFPARPAFALESALAGRFEARVAANADSVSVVAASDRCERGLERAAVIPNGVDPDAFPYREPSESRPPTVIFFGNLGYFHNVRPATFLADGVMSRVRSDNPDARLRLAGARPAAAVRRLIGTDGVEVVADPAEMAPLLHAAAVAAIPMFSGSGMKNKVLEAFSAGTPVVANATAVDGIEGVVAGEHFLLAEGEEQTANAIVGLLNDPGERVRLARAAHAVVTDLYSWERQAERMMVAYGLAPAI